MPRGGRRRPTPGKAYPQRRDLNERRVMPVMTGPSQGYGQRAALEEAQRAIPLATAPSSAAPAPQPPPEAPAGPPPGSFGDPLRATERPAEPITSGIPSGAGPGPEVLGLGPDFTIDEIRALYAAFPNEHLRQLIEDEDEGVLL